MTRFASLVLLLGLIASSATAQNPSAVHVPAPVRYGKWALLGGAVAFNLAALHQHHVADDLFAGITDECNNVDRALCDVDAAGRYTNPQTEATYQATLSADRRARTWLVAGETTLLASVAMFVWEFSRPKGPPHNIPFTPALTVIRGQPALGLTVAF